MSGDNHSNDFHNLEGEDNDLLIYLRGNEHTEDVADILMQLLPRMGVDNVKQLVTNLAPVYRASEIDTDIKALAEFREVVASNQDLQSLKPVQLRCAARSFACLLFSLWPYQIIPEKFREVSPALSATTVEQPRGLSQPGEPPGSDDMIAAALETTDFHEYLRRSEELVRYANELAILLPQCGICDANDLMQMMSCVKVSPQGPEEKVRRLFLDEAKDNINLQELQRPRILGAARALACFFLNRLFPEAPPQSSRTVDPRQRDGERHTRMHTLKAKGRS